MLLSLRSKASVYSNFRTCFFRYLSSSPLEDISLNIGSYGKESYPVSALASIRQDPRCPNGQTWLLSPYDKNISQDLRKELNAAFETSEVQMKVYFDSKTKELKAVPAPKRSWKQNKHIMYVPESKTFPAEDFEDDKDMTKIPKGWAPVVKADTDTAEKKKKKAVLTKKKQEAARAVAYQLGVNAVQCERLQRKAASNKKTMRQLEKKVGAMWDPAKKESWRPSSI